MVRTKQIFLPLLLLSACGGTEKDGVSDDSDTAITDTALPLDSDSDTGSVADTPTEPTGTETGDTGTTEPTTTTGTTPIGGTCDTPMDVCGTGECIVDLLPDSVSIVGQMLYDGSPVNTEGDGDDYHIIFVDEHGIETIFPFEGGLGVYQARVYPGSYDVYFQLIDPSGAVMRSVSSRWLVGRDLDLTSDTTIDILPTTIDLTGFVSFDGHDIPGGADVWAVHLHDTDTDEWLYYPKDGGTDRFMIPVFESTYDVYFEVLDTDVIPRSVTGKRLAVEGLKVAGPTTQDLTMTSIAVQGSLVWNGANIVDDGDGVPACAIHFVDLATGDRHTRTLAGGDGFYQAAVYPGEYQVLFELLDPTDTVISRPAMQEYQVSESFDVAGPVATLDIDLEPVELSGSIQYDESLILSDDAEPDYALHLDAVGTDLRYTTLMDGGRPSYAIAVLPGTYNLVFELLDTQGAVLRPVRHEIVLREDFEITSAMTEDISIVPVEVTGQVLYDGDMIQAPDPGADYQIWWTDRASGATVAYPGQGGRDDYILYTMPGSYDVDFELLDLDDAVFSPVPGRYLVSRRLDVTGDTVLDILPETVTVTGEVLFEGLPVQDLGAEPEWQVVFTSRDIATVSEQPMQGGDSTWSSAIYPGTWDVAFELLSARAVLNPVLGGRFTPQECADLQ